MRGSRALTQQLLLFGFYIALTLTLSQGLEQDAERIAIDSNGRVIPLPNPVSGGGGIAFLIPTHHETSTSSAVPTRTNGAQEEDFESGQVGSGEASLEEADYSGEDDVESGEGVEASGDEPSIEEDDIPLSELKAGGENVSQSDNVIPHDGQESKNSLVVASPRDLKASATGYGEGGHGGEYGHGGGGQYVNSILIYIFILVRFECVYWCALHVLFSATAGEAQIIMARGMEVVITIIITITVTKGIKVSTDTIQMKVPGLKITCFWCFNV